MRKSLLSVIILMALAGFGCGNNEEAAAPAAPEATESAAPMTDEAATTEGAATEEGAAVDGTGTDAAPAEEAAPAAGQ